MTFNVEHARVVVVGAGRSGRAAARLLLARGAHVTLADVSPTAFEGAEALAAQGVACVHGYDADGLRAADLIVLSPGVSPDQEPFVAARHAGVPVMGEIEMASRWLRGRLIAITGTKGKSTTTTLTARMLQEGGVAAIAGGNLGVALSEQVDESRPETVHVVEVSSFQLETTDTFHPWIAVLLNLSPDHLDRHPSFEAYADAKARVFRNQTVDDWAVVNADDARAVGLAARGRATRFDFGFDGVEADGVTVVDDVIVVRRSGAVAPVAPVASVRVPGRHLLADVLAAAAVSTVVGVPPASIARAVAGFSGLAHTLETVDTFDNVRFVNDSKATNVAAASRAIESFDRGVVAIMGGRYKGGAFEDLRESIRNRATAIVTIGEASDRIEAALADVVPVYRATSMREAVRRAYTLAEPNGVVLLAPACSSFDMFQDYAARGHAFAAEVRRLQVDRHGQRGA